MTAAQRLINQGIEQGIQRGREEGFREMLLRLVRQRFGDAVDAQVEQRIASASVAEIEAWFVRGLSAASLAEVFAA